MEKIDIILAKHFAGEATESEKKLLSEWRRVHPHEYEEASKVFEVAKEVRFRPVNHQESRNKLQLTKRGTVVGKRNWSLIAGIAAGLFLLLGLFYLVPQFSEGMILKTHLAQSDGELVPMADGTKIYLRAGSILTYPESFSKRNRSVSLVGDAYLDVTRDPNRPFVIDHPVATVEVLGTSFDIISDSLSFLLAVETGKVKLSDKAKDASIILEPGFSGHVGPEIRKFPTSVGNANAWRTKHLQFTDASIEQVIQDLRDFYKEEIQLMNSEEIACALTATFDNSSLEEILEILDLTCQLKIKKLSHGYEISPN